VSRCPDDACCRRPPDELAERWSGHAWPSARPHASMLAAMPAGAFPGVDQTEVLTFLERHAPPA
jgi:XRE family transcriptional regulator, fatty acid utilization regulator